VVPVPVHVILRRWTSKCVRLKESWDFITLVEKGMVNNLIYTWSLIWIKLQYDLYQVLSLLRKLKIYGKSKLSGFNSLIGCLDVARLKGRSAYKHSVNHDPERPYIYFEWVPYFRVQYLRSDIVWRTAYSFSALGLVVNLSC
jgi:hypothetical protein